MCTYALDLYSVCEIKHLSIHLMLETIYMVIVRAARGVNDSLTKVLSRKEPNVDHHWHVDLEKWGQSVALKQRAHSFVLVL